MPSSQFIDIAHSSTMDVASRVPVFSGPYGVHSAKLNEHHKEATRNGSNVSGTQKQSPSVNGVDHKMSFGFATPSSKRKDIFSSLNKGPIQPDTSIDIGVMWHNIAPAIQEDLVRKQASVGSHLRTESPDIEFKRKSTKKWHQLPKPPASIEGKKPSKFVDNYLGDYPWSLGDKLKEINNAIRSKSLVLSPTKPDPTSPSPKSKKQATNGFSTLDNGTCSPYASPTRRSNPTRAPPKVMTVDKTPPSITEVDYFTHTIRTTGSRSTPSSSATSPPLSPVFTDEGSGRAWSEFSHESVFSAATSPPLSPVVETSGCAFDEGTVRQKETPQHRDVRDWTEFLHESVFSPATTPPLPPVVETSGHTFDKGTVRQREILPQHRDVHALFDEDDTSDVFGDETPTISARVELEHPDIIPQLVVERPVITRRDIPELKAYTRPHQKKKPAKRSYERKAAKNVTLRTVGPRILPVPTSNQASSSRGIKRPASPAPRSHAPPAKRQAVQKKPPTSVALIRWGTSLEGFEQLAYEGKQGPREITRLVKLLEEMTASIDVVPEAWVRDKVRLREVAGIEEHKNRYQLLAEVVASYGECDAAGTVKSNAEKLLVKWGALTNRESARL
ncbi:hypothetical protein B0H19DRAFT_1078263 [Mycena capillaripes]|nr:hypothetical protein B0H19DRAFT_1078263 [Mycena capillaripes]